MFDRTAASEAALLQFLQSIRAGWISNERDPQTGVERLIAVSAANVRTGHPMMLWTELGFLDIYNFVPGFPDTPVQELFADAVALGELRFVSLSWLRKLKAHAGRQKDTSYESALSNCANRSWQVRPAARAGTRAPHRKNAPGKTISVRSP